MAASQPLPHTSGARQAPDRLLTAKELEAWLQIDVKTIYAYAQKGLIPYIRIQSGLRFRESEIVRWLDDRSFAPAPLRGK